MPPLKKWETLSDQAIEQNTEQYTTTYLLRNLEKSLCTLKILTIQATDFNVELDNEVVASE